MYNFDSYVLKHGGKQVVFITSVFKINYERPWSDDMLKLASWTRRGHMIMMKNQKSQMRTEREREREKPTEKGWKEMF